MNLDSAESVSVAVLVERLGARRLFGQRAVVPSLGRGGRLGQRRARDRGCDVAHCRYVLMRLDGEGAADWFLDAYESVTGAMFDPFWKWRPRSNTRLELDAGWNRPRRVATGQRPSLPTADAAYLGALCEPIFG